MIVWLMNVRVIIWYVYYTERRTTGLNINSPHSIPIQAIHNSIVGMEYISENQLLFIKFHIVFINCICGIVSGWYM